MVLTFVCAASWLRSKGRNMSEVVVAGISQIPVGEHWDRSLREMAVTAIRLALSDSRGIQPDALYVGNIHAPVLSDQAHLGALISDYAGLTGIEAATFESGGASGGAALHMGYLAVASGAVDTVLVLGVEKYTDRVGPSLESAAATLTDSDYEAVHGLTPTSQAALIMQRYLHDFVVPKSAFAGFVVTAHENGALNENAMFRSPITAETYQNAAMVSHPLNLMDIAPVADGAAALVLTRPELIPQAAHRPDVFILGTSMVNDRLALHDRWDLLSFDAARLSVQQACRQAGIHPGEVDFFELHDAFTIFSALSLEAAGFADRGQGWKLAQEGKIKRDGLLPVSTFGGLKARGYPGGATGVYQAVEAVLQLRGQAGLNQVNGAQYGLIQCLGGAAATAVTHILKSDSI
jgi:acetyl-CoA C-acetyltransferase